MSFAHRSRGTALAAALSLMVGMGLAVLPATPASATSVIQGISTHWSPTTTTILQGGSVRWMAVSNTHHVKAYGGNWTFQSRFLHPGQSTLTKTFNTRGTFRFYCTIHGAIVNGVCQGMCGRIVVR